MDTLEIVDKIEELVEKSKKLPFSSNAIINENEIYDLVDELRSLLPEELKQARWIVKEREGMIEEAKRQSVRIVKEAEERAQVLVSETEVLKNANKKAEEIMTMVEAKARTIRLEAEDYADEKLANLEAVLHKLLSAVEKGREQFKATLKSEQ
ncbi:MAG: ATPase [Actinomycetota bacterium]|jgi:vacuolar-type H+-ATPase subunit H|nr:ATPase [Actinomycetota bacterium]